MAEKAALVMTALDRSQLKLLTLTLRSSKAPLADQLSNLRAAFRRLRQRQIWKKSVTGGFGVIEVTFNATTHEWHPHLHVVAQATYIPQQQLSASWFAVTQTSTIVDIRVCKPQVNLAQYLAKYLAKPPPLQNFDSQLERLLEFRTALDRSRLLIRFGKLDSQPLKTSKEVEFPNDWQSYSSFDHLLELCRHHDSQALYVYQRLMSDSGFASTPRAADPPLSHNSPMHMPDT